MTYTFLLFDLDHTLLDFESAEETALTQMLEDMNFPDVQAFKDYYKPMNQGLWKDLEQKKLTKQELVDSRFAIGFAHFGITVDGAEMALRYQDYISLQGSLSTVRRTYWLDLKKQVTSSMVQRTE